MSSQRIYRFGPTGAEGNASMKALLGGKGANLAEMAGLGIPVPPGFTITTEGCNLFQSMADTPSMQAQFLDELLGELLEPYDWLASHFGYHPLVSVRSGAPMSMPGMMDTILNVGLCSTNLQEWKDRLGERAALDSYRRLIQMLGATAYGVPHEAFDALLAQVKASCGVTEDKDLDPAGLEMVIDRYQQRFAEHTGMAFPDTAYAQLRAAVVAVFRSWNNERAEIYRQMHGIPASVGTAVNIQAMVFGNLNDQSGTGVLFSRNPSTGEPKILGEFLVNAQGEDVVAGIRTPMPLEEMTKLWPELAVELAQLTGKLEKHYRDMMDIEFTVQGGKLWLLQCRVGKRSALAAVAIALDLHQEGLIQALPEVYQRVTAEQYKLVRRARVSPSYQEDPAGQGLAASIGVATGVAVFSAKAAIDCKDRCILITDETDPDDIGGMAKAQGILTRTGGITSHAAVVARAMDKPCVTGCGQIEFQSGQASLGGVQIVEGQTKVTICGETGRVWLDREVLVEDGSQHPAVIGFEHLAAETKVKDSLPLARTLPEVKRWQLAGLPVMIRLELYEGALYDLMEHLSKSDRTKVTVDLRGPTLAWDEADLGLLNGLNMVERTQGHAINRARTLVGAPILAGLRVISEGDPLVETLCKQNGIVMAETRPAATLAELIADTDTVVTPEFVSKVLGGEWVLDKLKDVIPPRTSPVQSALPVESVVFRMLAG